MGASTAKELEGFAIIEADLIQVVGRQTPERIFILAGEQKEAATDGFKALVPLHKKFLSAHRAQDWKTARSYIAALKKLSAPLEFDGYYDVMSARMDAYEINPPDKDWGGIYVATSK